MNLHLLNQSPAKPDALHCCLSLSNPGDGLLLLEDGVYWLANTQWLPSTTHLKLYALEGDIASRGLLGRVHDTVQRVDYRQFVRLCAKHERVISWY